MNLDFPVDRVSKQDVYALARILRVNYPGTYTSLLIDATGVRVHRIVCK